MRATFVTHDHGTIEIEKGGEAYFRKYDYLAPVAEGGTFTDPWGRSFEVLWPFRTGQGANLRVHEPRTIAFSDVTFTPARGATA